MTGGTEPGKVRVVRAAGPRPDGLGSEATFDGRPRIGRDRTIFGPYADPAGAPMRIARNPMGRDFLIFVREAVRSHGFVGGNAFLLDLLADNREALEVAASDAALRRNALATRRQLAQATVALSIGGLSRAAGNLHFTVRVENRTGHKFPSGYPSRRAWLHVQARDQGGVVFDSGGYTADDEIADVADELRQPHANLVTEPSQVVVWELIALDPEGEPTTYLSRMAGVGKDTRLLPKGWRRDGPHAATTAPVGIGNDVDFTAGGDTVSFAVPVGQHGGPATVTAWVHYQTIPPHWVAPMRRIDAVECRTFVAMYDAADKTPETAGVAVRSEGG